MVSSVYLVTAIIGLGGMLFGYDIGIISGVLAFDSFKTDFHIDDWNNHLLEQGLIVSSFVVGNLCGALLASRVADQIGRKRTLVCSAVLFIAASSLQVFAWQLPVLYVGRYFSGLAVGVLTMIVPLYNSELAPKEIRGRLISFNQISMTGGILIAFWCGYGLRDVTNGWRYALGGQIFPAIIILLASPLLPQSPRWLIKVGRIGDARRNLNMLRGMNAEMEFDLMVDTIHNETLLQKDTWSYLFNDPTSRRRLIICMVLQTGQQLTGINVIMYYMPFIAQSVGFGHGNGLLAQGVNGIVNFLSTFVAFFFVDKIGRTTMLRAGGIIMAVAMGTLGGLGMAYAVVSSDKKTVTVDNAAAGWVCVIAIYLYVFGFAFSWGPVCWLYPTEVFPTSQRGKGVALSTTSNFAFNFLIAQFTPLLRSKMQFGMFVMFSVLCLLMVIFVSMFVPETRGKSLEELGVVFGGATKGVAVALDQQLLGDNERSSGGGSGSGSALGGVAA
jgi:sugar porter (SP) family MFS transporter